MVDEEIKIKVTTESAKAEKALVDVADKTDEVGASAEDAKSKWATLSSKLSAISPTFAKMSDGWGKASKEIDDSFGSNTASAKLFKLGVIGALVAIAAKAAKVAWQFANETASMFDPQGYAQASGQMQASIKKLKTAIGSFTAPVVNAILKGISKITDGITWIVEKLRIAVAYIQGVMQPVVDAIASAFWKVVDAIKAGINGISSFLGFGEVFKTSEEAVSSATDAVTELTDATSAGLAGFDKLNTLSLDNAGDAEESEKIAEDIAQAKKDGEDLAGSISSMFSNIDVGTFFGDIGEDISGLWNGFTTWGGEAWGKVTKWGGDTWDKVSTWGGDTWNSITTWGGNAWNSISTWGGNAWSSISTTAGETWGKVTQWGGETWDSISTTAGNAWDTVSTTAGDVWNNVTLWGGNAWDTIKTSATAAWGLVSAPILSVWGTFKSLGESAWSGIQSIGETFKRAVIDPISNTVSWLLEKVEWLLGKVGGLKDTVSNIGGSIGNAIGGVVGGIKSVFGLASGGAVAPNNPQPYILGDNTRDYEIVSPVPLMEQAVMSAISKMNANGTGGSSGPIEITINLDGRKVARQIFDPLQTEARRRGTSI